VHLPGVSQLDRWAAEVPPAARLLAAKFWPGPLTLILRRAPAASLTLTGGQDSIGLRVPAHPVAQALLRAFDGGIAAPSANKYGHVSPTTAAHVRAEFGAGSDAGAPLILDGGACPVGIESTIVDARTNTLRVLRPGMLGAQAIADALQGLPGVEVVDGADAAAPRVPGSIAAHYAPAVPLQILPSDKLRKLVQSSMTANEKIAVIGLSAAPTDCREAVANDMLHWLALGSEPNAYARDLYAALRDLETRGVSQIFVERPPDDPSWRAILDRLQRAAHGARHQIR
jgi:L-threonylcarbamoyladenylate synthase